MDRATENIKLVLGSGSDEIKLYLVIGDGYLSAETTDGRDTESLVTIRELMDLVTLALAYGVPLQAICGCLKYHMDGRGENRITNTPYVSAASSVPDLIGRYLENRIIKEPMIKRILRQGLDYSCTCRRDPKTSVGPDGRKYMDWTTEELQKKLRSLETEERTK